MLSATSLAFLLSAGIAPFVSAHKDVPTTSTCAATTFDGEFELVPVNLFPDTDIIGPTSLDAVNFITLGIAKPSDYGDVLLEKFTLYNGKLFETNGISVYFASVTDLDPNKYGVTDTSVMQAGDCEGGCGDFCVDDEGYLISTKPLITNSGEYVADRVKFYACPNYEQSTFGGGDYKIYSNGVYNPSQCIPIYLGLKKVTEFEEPEPAPLPCEPEGPCEHPHVTQIWDGQLQAPTPVPISPCGEQPCPIPAPCPSPPCPVPAPCGKQPLPCPTPPCPNHCPPAIPAPCPVEGPCPAPAPCPAEGPCPAPCPAESPCPAPIPAPCPEEGPCPIPIPIPIPVPVPCGEEGPCDYPPPCTDESPCPEEGPCPPPCTTPTPPCPEEGPCPAPYPEEPYPEPCPAESPCPAPPSPCETCPSEEEPSPPLISEISDGQIQAPEEMPCPSSVCPLPTPTKIVPPYITATPTKAAPPPPPPTTTVAKPSQFEGAAGRTVVHSWLVGMVVCVMVAAVV